MRIINSFCSLRKAFPNRVFDMEIWRDYAVAISPNLASKCENDSQGYDFQTEVLPVIQSALADKAKLDILSDVFDEVARDLTVRITKLFDKEIELEIILYLGLCNGAGWATTLDGRDVILLGIEKIIELDWYSKENLQALIFHEIGHIWHKTYGKMSFQCHAQTEKSIIQLYQEGIAMVCEQILYGDDTHYHQNQNGWLSWCTQNESLLKKEYLARLNHEQSTQDFFGDWNSYKDHSNTGYYLGCQFIKYLQKKFSLIDIANLSYQQLRDEFICFAQ